MKTALRSMLLGAAALAAAVAFAPRTDAGVHVGIHVGVPLPPLPHPPVVRHASPVHVPPPVAVRPRYRGHGYGYRAGYYRHAPAYGPGYVGYGPGYHGPHGYVWVDGAWVLPPWPGAVWVPAYRDRWGAWVPGGWRRY